MVNSSPFHLHNSFLILILSLPLCFSWRVTPLFWGKNRNFPLFWRVSHPNLEADDAKQNLKYRLRTDRTTVMKSSRWGTSKQMCDLSKDDILNFAWHRLLQDLDEIPSRRRSKIHTKTEEKGQDLQQLRQSFYSCPELMELYKQRDSRTSSDQPNLDNPPNASPIQRFVDHVGSIHKAHLINMLSRHPSIMASVLVSGNVRSCREQLMMDLSIQPNEWNPVLDDIIRGRMYRQDLRCFIRHFIIQLCFPTEELKQILTRYPQLLRYSLAKLQTNVDFLTGECAFDCLTVRKMIRLRPLILAYSLDQKIKPVIHCLVNDLHLDNWKHIISRYPQVLTIPISRLKAKAYFLANRLNLQRESDSAALASGFPPILWLREENILQKIQFIQETFLFDDEGLRDVIVTFPQLLGLSLEKNLKPKVEFLLGAPNHGAGLSKDELRELIAYQPALLAYSLSKRIRPRIETMQRHGISFSFVPSYIMSMSNSKFDRWMNIQLSSWSTN